MLSIRVGICISVLFSLAYKGDAAAISPLPTFPPICATVLCALPDCPNPIPPKKGECCPTCPLDLVCPAIPPGSFGICVELCSADDDCSAGQLCCSNGCGHVCKTGVPRPKDICIHDGQIFKVGDTFPQGDGCNTCTCESGGLVSCTEIACLPKGCSQGGVHYEIGESFPSDDGCNTCSCIRPNVIVCTLIACPEPTPSVCPPDKPPVNCFVDPCMFAECPAHPDAKCVADYCGGCNARWFIGDKEVTDTCKCPVKGQVFNDCGSACPPNCTTPNPICTKQCVARCECPDGQVIDETTNKCVPVDECPSPCPPVCTAAFCKDNKWGKCTIPGPREIPGCTGECQFTFCSACYFSDEPRPLPGNCPTCGGPISSKTCYKKWADCIGKADVHEHGCLPAIAQTEDRFRCYRYPCPLKG